MNNLTDQMVLEELLHVASGLEGIVNGLRQMDLTTEQQNSRSDGMRLLGQWQKLFQGSETSLPAACFDQSRLTDDLQQLITRLQSLHHRSSQLHQQGREQLSQAAYRLHDSPHAPDRLKTVLSALESAEQGVLGQLKPLFECYFQALDLCSQRQQQEQRSQHKLCQRLLLLIDELDYSGAIGEEISAIQSRLLEQVEPATLSKLCNRLIELVIEGNRIERQHSNRFLASISEDLEGMQNHFSTSIREGQALLEARDHQGSHLHNELKAIENHLLVHDDQQLKERIRQHMVGLEHTLKEHARLQERERSLLKHISELEGQLHRVKKQTADYQQRLTSQNEKLFIDSLTQIYNRNALSERFEVEYRRWVRSQAPLCIALLDIDHFKNINDRYGHLAGDKALRLIARTIKQSLRDSDFVARFGGEEFVILMLDVNPEQLQRPLEHLRSKIEAIPFRFKEERVTITASLGATLLQQGDTTTSALERADQALYRAKNAGRNQFVIA